MKTSARGSILIIFMIALFASCEEAEPELRDPCDFFISAEEVPMPLSTNPCATCFFKFTFQGKLYTFDDDRMPDPMMSFGEDGREVISNRNDFFEFKLNSLHRSQNLFLSLGQQRALLTPDSLKMTDSSSFQAAFVMKDRCGGTYQVAENTNIYVPDISHNTISNISVWSSELVNAEYFSTTYIISGEFTSQVLIGGEPEPITGSYSLLYSIIDEL